MDNLIWDLTFPRKGKNLRVEYQADNLPSACCYQSLERQFNFSSAHPPRLGIPIYEGPGRSLPVFF